MTRKLIMTQAKKSRTVSTPNQFGKFCSKLRIDADLTAPEWAKLLETSTQTVNAYEYGRRDLDIPFLAKVAVVVGKYAPEALAEFNENFVASKGVIFTGSLTQEQKELIAGVLNGTVRAVSAPAEAQA